ncbi:MAG: hypothetical protein GX032_04520 [Tenericutes bacterium]|nr:hypothetical protein [Bacilli bacterium]MDD3995659.1 hypothetical protein [Bacilli bacterium]MDD4624669.1 hypothetical protein [Bacilli bacterium]MDD4831319.1 hypothetical protein [Bacilli bacterium]NLV90714.1 hypothetical protein [Mycoplasmatota bacterium]
MKKNKYGLIIWLSVLFPQIALFLYLMEDNKNTDKAKALLSGLNIFIGFFIVSLILFVLLVILPMIFYIFNNLIIIY